MIPAILVPLVVADNVRRGTHVVHSTISSNVIGWAAIVLIFGVPVFLAGRLYDREHRG